MQKELLPKDIFHQKINARAHRVHVRELWLQIIVPLVLGVALGSFGLYALLNANVGNVTRAAELATILLTIPLLVMGILFFVIIVALIYLLGRAMNWIPTQTIRAQRVVERINMGAVMGANLIAKPVMLIDSWSNAINRAFRRQLPK